MSALTVKAVVNGSEIELERNSDTGMWEGTAVAPAKSSYNQDGHYYGVTIIATDEAGNTTTIDASDSSLGEALQLVVKETDPPVINIVSPTEGELTSNSKPTVEFVVTDEDSGVAEFKMVIDGTTVTGFTTTEIDGGYDVKYVCDELEDGQHTIQVDATDNDGNKAETVAVTFDVQTSAPSLSVTSPADDTYFNTTSVIVAGTTDGAKVTVTINNNDPVEVTVTDGAFQQEFTLDEGSNSITITAVSESGVETSITRTVTVDTHAPVFKSVSLTPNPVDAGKTYIISVEVTDE